MNQTTIKVIEKQKEFDAECTEFDRTHDVISTHYEVLCCRVDELNKTALIYIAIKRWKDNTIQD